MRLKTKLVLAISGLVFLMVCALCWIFLYQMLEQRISQSYASNDMVAHQILFATQRALETDLSGRIVKANDPNALRAAAADVLRKDPGLNSLLDSAIRYSPTVLDVTVANSEGFGIVSTDPMAVNTLLPARKEYGELQRGGLVRLLEVVFGPPRVYNITLPLERAGQPFLTVRVGIRTTFLRFVVEPWLVTALTYTGVAIFCSLIVAAFLANLALRPIEQIGKRLDALDRVEAVEADAGEGEGPNESDDAVVLVSHKIERIGRRMRNVEEVFSALKEGLDQIMTNLQDGIVLFTHDARAVLVSDSVERFLGLGRRDILGAELHDIFSRDTRLGSMVRESFDARMVLVQEEITTETGRRVEISLDFIHDDQAAGPHRSLGALLTLHDLESVREIESEIELSRRLAAIGRLTAGVGHEVKNPINAIVVHLELMRNKLGGGDGNALRHLEIIASEIQRLDRVVQTLVDFSRPVELQLKEQDLRRIVSAVLMLASAELETRDVHVLSHLPDHPVIAKVDADLLKQALLNVVLNGAQAMAGGGLLEVRLAEHARTALLSIHDEGGGIPEDIRDKIFDLYFTTKKDGSGIGLAMTYRIVQLHNGSVEVESGSIAGTTFTLRFPLAAVQETRARGYLAPNTRDSGGIGRGGGTQRMRPLGRRTGLEHFCYTCVRSCVRLWSRYVQLFFHPSKLRLPGTPEIKSCVYSRARGYTCRKNALAAMLAASLTGCSSLHMPFRQPPPPPLQTGQGSLDVQAKQQHPTPPPLPQPLAQTAPPSLPPAKQQKAKRRKKATREERGSLPAATQEPPANAPAPAKPAAAVIGNLTPGDSATESKTKLDTENLIAQTEQGLTAIKRRLSKDEQTTAGQIRTFLGQAKQALATGDSDGANTLATKAKLLLDELTQE